MKPVVYKRSVIVGGHKTSISLEEAFWREVRAIADARRIAVAELLREINDARQTPNFSSAIRVYVLAHVRAQADATRPRHTVGA